MKTGIILLDKAEGPSSAQAIAQVKRRLRLDKIGHAGTLDPFATGLLLCLAGRATKLSSLTLDGPKEYSGEIRLGVKTSSDDRTGEVLAMSSLRPDGADIFAAVRTFTGTFMQRPPLISAVKVDGKASYKRVRQLGETPELKERKVSVERFEVRSCAEDLLSFHIRCSSGTYIRSIARDLGDLLGCGAALESLRREYSHPFSVNEARRIEELAESDTLHWSVLFPDVPFFECDRHAVECLERGDQRVIASFVKNGKLPATASRLLCGERKEEPAAILGKENGRWVLIVYIG